MVNKYLYHASESRSECKVGLRENFEKAKMSNRDQCIIKLKKSLKFNAATNKKNKKSACHRRLLQESPPNNFWNVIKDS